MELYILGGLVIILFAIILIKSYQNQKQQREMALRWQQWEGYFQELSPYLDRQGERQLQEQKEEISAAFRTLNENLLGNISQIANMQTLKLDVVQKQFERVGENQEQRLDRMQTTISKSLLEYDGQMNRMTQTMDQKLLQNEQRIEKMRITLFEGMEKLQGENAKKLEEMRKTVDEKLHDTLDKRLGDSFSQVSKRLEEVYKGLGEMQNLARGVGDLKKVLSNVKVRGTWGEVQLGALLSQILAPAQYGQNVKVHPYRDERVEFALYLPGKGEGEAPVYLPIDSKFPQEASVRLQKAQELGEADKITQSKKELETAFKTEAKRIAQKYIVSPYTTDFAILFLPLEGLYAEAVQSITLMEQLQQQYRVVVAGPSTIAALLNSLQMGFRTLAIEQRSTEVWHLLEEVKNDFGKFALALEKTQLRMRQASESINDAYSKSKRLERKLQKVENLEEPGYDNEKEPEAGEQIEPGEEADSLEANQ